MLSEICYYKEEKHLYLFRIGGMVRYQGNTKKEERMKIIHKVLVNLFPYKIFFKTSIINL